MTFFEKIGQTGEYDFELILWFSADLKHDLDLKLVNFESPYFWSNQNFRYFRKFFIKNEIVNGFV